MFFDTVSIVRSSSSVGLWPPSKNGVRSASAE
jgi:hypothetical protein